MSSFGRKEGWWEVEEVCVYAWCGLEGHNCCVCRERDMGWDGCTLREQWKGEREGGEADFLSLLF